MITEKLAYIIYLRRIKEEERIDLILGNSDSDYRRAQNMVEFFEEPKSDSYSWKMQFEDYEDYYADYLKLKQEEQTNCT